MDILASHKKGKAGVAVKRLSKGELLDPLAAALAKEDTRIHKSDG